MHIPPELFHDIALFCTPKTVIHLQHSCTVLRKLLQNKRIWKHLVSLHFQTTFTEAINQSSTFNILALYFAGYPLDQQEQGIVPMSHAARMGEHRIVQLLLRLGAGDQMNFDQSTALMDTIENGYFDTARTMLQLGHSPNRESNLGITPFQIAAKNGLGGLCYDMIDRHLDIHFRNVQRRTHLHEAARFEDGYHYVTCRILIDAGALIDVPNTWGITPLMLAVRQNNLKVIQLLIDSGADINFTTAGGLNAFNNRLLIVAMLKAGVDVNQPSERTFPLIYCLQKRRESLAKLLIESGAKDLVSNNSTPLMLMLEHGYFDLAASFIKKTECMANVMNQCGVTVFGLACKRKQTQICELLVPHLDFTWKNVHSRTHLHEASRYGMPSICQKLLDGGVDPNQADFQHNTPLHESVRHCCFQTTRLLLEHGANPNTVNNWGMYPLMIAAELHDLPTMEILLEHGADPNLSGSRDCTALFAAVYKSNLNGVKLLLKHGADPNHKNYLSRTVLHEALRSREMEMVSLFLKEDPSLDTEDHFGETPVMYCIYHDIPCRLPDKRLVNLLLHFGYGNETNDDNSCAFMDLLKIQHPVAADWLRRGIVNPNTVSDMGETPFMIACQLGLENMCSLMLSCGLDLRYTTPRGRTLLHDVCRFGLVNVAKALIAAGAPNQADVFGTTPMHEAVRSMRSDTFTILDGPMTADLWGLTPLKLAIKIQSSCFDDMLQVEIMNQIPSDDIPALHYCVITNKLAHARRLLEAKCDVNLQNNQDKTALHYASQLRDMDAFALLLEFGAKVEIKDTFGQSPLTIVVTSDLACAHLLSTEQKGMLKKATIGFRSGQLLENKKWCMIPETSVSIC
ncbi:ankyrin repeat-containing domain protein [Gorgonomyces haynaldii]|nr:ankyrin repeat-containing domain protein [Gorgonomyces haynaldii]